MNNKIRRRNYLINKTLQFAYSGLAIWILLIAIILIGSFTYYITLQTILSEMEAQNQLFNAYQVVKNINMILGKRLGLMLTAVIIFTLVLEIFYLHRIAGPVYRIQKTLNEMSEGKKIDSVRLREKDFFKTLAEAVNNLIKAQKGKEEKIRQLLDEVEKESPQTKEKTARIKQLID
jgi:methyl-accepting chemotaxis protein